MTPATLERRCSTLEPRSHAIGKIARYAEPKEGSSTIPRSGRAYVSVTASGDANLRQLSKPDTVTASTSTVLAAGIGSSRGSRCRRLDRPMMRAERAQLWNVAWSIGRAGGRGI
jgi:hypothetical protein